MSKIRINDKVIVKENGKIGIVKGREITDLDNGKMLIEYVVKIGEGFQNWKSYSRKELKKVVPQSNKKPMQILVTELDKGYTITMVAIVGNGQWKETKIENDELVIYMHPTKDLSIGYSICSPHDEYDSEIGIRIAKHRAKKSPFCKLNSNFSGEFNKETIDALLKVKTEYIANNIERFINKR